MVEPAAVRLAASRATAQDIADMEEAYAGMKRAIDFGGDYITPDLRFRHDESFAAAERLNRLLDDPRVRADVFVPPVEDEDDSADVAQGPKED